MKNLELKKEIENALSKLIAVTANLATQQMNSEDFMLMLPKKVSNKAIVKIIQLVEHENELNRKRAIELRNCYDIINKSIKTIV